MSSNDYSSDDSSDRWYDDSGHCHACTLPTGPFNGHECSRYNDCPAHTRRRSDSADSDGEDEDQDGLQEEEVDGHHEQGLEDAEGGGIDEEEQLAPSSDLQDVRPLRPGELVDLGIPGRVSEQPQHNYAMGTAHNAIDLTTFSPPPPSQGGAGVPGPSDASGHSDRQAQGRGHAAMVIDLTGDTPLPEVSPPSGARSGVERSNEERALPTIPASASGVYVSLSTVGTVPPSAQRRPSTPPSPPPPLRRRTSTNHFGTAPRPTTMQAPRPPAFRRPSELMLPRWQPDAEVTFCPICRTQFSFLIRKHHCRKCGRVVCNRCSPHRITIPYQYIVQPPGTPRPGAQRYPASLISGEGGHADFSSLGGGEKVRLCNPCVPDPNTNPPDSKGSPTSVRGHVRSQSSAGSGGGHGFNAADSLQPGPRFDAFARNRSATMVPSASRQSFGSRIYQPSPSRIWSGTPPSNYPHAHAGSPFGSYPNARHMTAYDVGQPSSSSSAAAHGRPLPPDPPQLAEEDECPICHRELPPQSLANSEELRETHISTCITSHSTYGGSSTGEDSRPRRTGMFPYSATEKDCVDSAECTICLEEFEVAVPMARLECLCRFHRDCISRWFAKNPGRCPVHSHDGHGF